MDGNAEADAILIGAGPGGVATAKTMMDEGLEPIVFGPIVPSQFRLSGHGADSDGEARFRADLAWLGRDPADPLPEEVDLLRTLAAAEVPYPAALGALHTLKRD